jgi:hypothetical protein
MTPEWWQVDDSRVVATCKTSGLLRNAGIMVKLLKCEKLGIGATRPPQPLKTLDYCEKQR